ncbi:hypothetical protein WJX73_007866 [Symbiochloris irregularis]|uniref:Protein kinase domain-containing protein n=1 Tax=Symbiochloris irregularis TaxID=706552 RepID=A0AAW1NUZ9_9CHLO
MRLIKNTAINKQLAAKFITRKDSKLLSEATDAAVVKHSCLHHINLVGFREVYKTHDHLVIAMEYIPGSMTLEAKATASGPMKEADIRPYFRQLVQCMSYCHSQEGYHTNLRLDRILIDTRAPQPIVKLTDFLYRGPDRTSSSSSSSEKGDDVAGPSKYTPPEQLVLLQVKNDGSMCDAGAIDVWALGVILHVMLTGRFPFLDKVQPGNVTARVMRRMALDEFEFSSKPFAQGASSEVEDLLQKMFQRDPEQRIKAAQILEHPWLKGAESTSEEPADPVTAAPMQSTQSQDDIIHIVKRARRKRLW